MSFIISLIVAIFIMIMTGLNKTVMLYENNLIFSLLIPLLIGTWSYGLVLRIDFLKAGLVYIVSSVMGTVVIVGLAFAIVGTIGIEEIIKSRQITQADAEIEQNPIEMLDSESIIPED